MNDDRRKAKRFTVVDLELFLQDPEEKIGQVVNLSEGGLLIVTESPFEAASYHQFRIPFNQTINGRINFDFEGRVVWCNPNALDSKKYSVGLEYAENPELQTLFVQQMIKVFGA
jgi:Tfp pilus assembly protein PilZ